MGTEGGEDPDVFFAAGRLFGTDDIFQTGDRNSPFPVPQLHTAFDEVFVSRGAVREQAHVEGPTVGHKSEGDQACEPLRGDSSGNFDSRWWTVWNPEACPEFCEGGGQAAEIRRSVRRRDVDITGRGNGHIMKLNGKPAYHHVGNPMPVENFQHTVNVHVRGRH